MSRETGTAAGMKPGTGSKEQVLLNVAPSEEKAHKALGNRLDCSRLGSARSPLVGKL